MTTQRNKLKGSTNAIEPMRTIAFYSFKGGVGRSLALANMAYIFCQQFEKKVGLVDLDVESPGLHHILEMKIPIGTDLTAFLLPENRKIVQLGHYVHAVSAFRSGGAKAFLVPSTSNVQTLQQIKWDTSIESFLRQQLFPNFGRVYDLNYLLIDGRTGLSRFSAVAIMQADLVLLFARLDQQNEYGIGRMVKVCKEAGKPFLLVVSSCPTIKGYTKAIAGFEKRVKSEVHCVLPYLPDLYFKEFIVTQSAPKSSLSKGYQNLAELITAFEYDK